MSFSGNIFEVLMYLIGFFTINYLSHCLFIYIDNRYSLQDNVDDTAIVAGLFLGVIMISFYLAMLLLSFACMICKNTFAKYFKMSLHKKARKLGKKHGEQDRDVDYQAEKYLLDGKK